MSATSAKFNTASCTDATVAPSFNYAMDFCTDTANVVSVFVFSVAVLAEIISCILLYALIGFCK